MAVVLCTGIDPVLMKTRQLILENAGHSVVPVMDEREIKAACAKQQFDVAVIGQNMPLHTKRRLFEAVKEHCPAVKVLELYPLYAGRALRTANTWLAMPSEPGELVEAVNALVP
jgi:CheY-like chemotaxis protein